MEQKRIFTFWEPKEKMPEYIKQCIKTWKNFLPDYEIVILDYENLEKWLSKNYYDKYLYKSFSLAIQSDAIRCAILKMYGGIWLDADTLITSNSIKTFLNSPADFVLAGKSIGFIVANKDSYILNKWQKYIFKKIAIRKKYKNIFTYMFNYKFYRKFKAWDYLGNSIINRYINNAKDRVQSIPIEENYIMPEKIFKKENNINSLEVQNYREFYFYNDYSDYVIKNTKGLLLLHNSWTPKEFMGTDFLDKEITLSKLLKKFLSY